MSYDPKGSDTENNVGALADGFANSAINSTEVDEGSTGYVGGVANGDNRNNTDNSTDVDVDAKVDIAANNGDNRDNEYDWSYDSKSYSNTETDTDIKTVSDNDTKTVTDTDIKTDYDWSYDSKSYSNTETDTDIKTVTDTDTDIKTVTETATDSYNSTDTDFAVLEDVKDNGNLGIAGGDLTFNLGDDFSFTLDVDNILNDSLNGQGNDAGFSAVQASHLADQDSAWNVRMDNGGAQNQLSANGGNADSSEGVELDGKCWDLKAGDDVAGNSTADASAILANSGFHFEFVQGANLLGNTIDSSIIGGNSHVSDVGEDTGA
ncbi:fibrinogen-binding protein [Ciceribacter ferrooxidans]|uniref:Fibrinogen-binding protein n=1 Tax=Ciceribacter ferrooxidans TaxID=2509717 RepID=A0A4V1RQT5_9HYPH|nr:fibrinogen-binding protein [Ciceribacter ferrooxidans]RYC13977.1 fibrinogen-binding protein [Ciceribacter ferrooxidans]